MSSVDRVGIEHIILTSRDRELSHHQNLRLAVEVAIPILLGFAYVAVLFFSAKVY